jgi:hypothetical protein
MNTNTIRLAAALALSIGLSSYASTAVRAQDTDADDENQWYTFSQKHMECNPLLDQGFVMPSDFANELRQQGIPMRMMVQGPNGNALPKGVVVYTASDSKGHEVAFFLFIKSKERCEFISSYMK